MALYRYLGPLVSHYAGSRLKRSAFIRKLPELCPGEGEILVAGCGLGLTSARLTRAFPERKLIAIESPPG